MIDSFPDMPDVFGSVRDTAVPLRRDDTGTVRVANTRITLDHIVELFEAGASAEEISCTFPSLNLADVYLVLGYLKKNEDQIATYIRAREKYAAQLRAEIESEPANITLRKKLLSGKRAVRA